MTVTWSADDGQEDELFPQQILSYLPSDLVSICVDAKGDFVHQHLHQHPVYYPMKDRLIAVISLIAPIGNLIIVTSLLKIPSQMHLIVVGRIENREHAIDLYWVYYLTIHLRY